MAVGIGSKSKLAYVIETAYGVMPASPAGINIGFLTESIQNTRNTFNSEEISPSRQTTSIRSGNVAAAGDISMELSPNALGTFFKQLLMVSPTTTTVVPTVLTNSLAVTRGTYYETAAGSFYLCTRSGNAASDAATVGPVTTDFGEELNGTAYFQYFSDGTVDPIKHVFQAAVAKPTGGFAMEREAFLDTGSKFFRYIGGRINTMALTVPQEGIVTCNFGFIFLDLDSTATSTIFTGTTAPVDEPFAGSGCVIRMIGYGGSLADDFSIETLTLNVTNNFDTSVYSIGQKRRRDLPEGRRVVTGSMTAYFEDMTKFTYFQNESIVTMFISFNHVGQFLSITMPETRLTGGAPAPVIGGNGVLKHSFDFTAFKTNGAGDIKIELFNTTASY